MPAFPIPQSENIVTVGATGVYVAKSGDVVVAAPGAAVHLPSVPLPVVATQAQAPTGAATGLLLFRLVTDLLSMVLVVLLAQLLLPLLVVKVLCLSLISWVLGTLLGTKQ